MKIPTTKGQLRHELNWLCVKVQRRDPHRYQQLLAVQAIECHPSFEVVDGDIEEWEKGKGYVPLIEKLTPYVHLEIKIPLDTFSCLTSHPSQTQCASLRYP